MFDEPRRSMKVSTCTTFRVDLYRLTFAWLDTLRELQADLPHVASDFVGKLTQPKLEKLAECLADAMDIEAFQVHGHTDFSPMYAPVLKFEVVLDVPELVTRFWEALAMEYEDDNGRVLLSGKVATAFATITADVRERLQPYLLDALERDFRAYLEIENL